MYPVHHECRTDGLHARVDKLGGEPVDGYREREGEEVNLQIGPLIYLLGRPEALPNLKYQHQQEEAGDFQIVWVHGHSASSSNQAPALRRSAQGWTSRGNSGIFPVTDALQEPKSGGDFKRFDPAVKRRVTSETDYRVEGVAARRRISATSPAGIRTNPNADS